ncbi:hypothetical protein OG444_39590 [Streptomyces sp. NBC_01232]|uniref:hypothetical protein n=1 Tax=Streptomyces sp. NBC_01232 TaxID=2903786 RepID=UPI002E112E80|nr:hypothetical protein OG444_00240 [Streptomyces sp. NBC_01232]WSQ03235.1 hypothetical protein OG444_39590 [Streptomyces sp. NBC_01232]
MCVAYSVGTLGKATCVALSLPAHEQHRLQQAAPILGAHSPGVLPALLLAEMTCGR